MKSGRTRTVRRAPGRRRHRGRWTVTHMRMDALILAALGGSSLACFVILGYWAAFGFLWAYFASALQVAVVGALLALAYFVCERLDR